MGSLTDCSLSLQYNADIAGQGVRISFYIQNFVLGEFVIVQICSLIVDVDGYCSYYGVAGS